MSTDTTTPNGEPKRRFGSRWLWGLLIASLALNLLVFGAMAGHALRHGGWERGLGHGFFGGRLLRAIPETKRAEVEALLAAKRGEIDEGRQGATAARLEALKLFEAEPFDRVAFEAALQRMSEKELAARRSMLLLVGEIGSKLTTEERKKIMRHLPRRLLGGGWRLHSGEGGP